MNIAKTSLTLAALLVSLPSCTSLLLATRDNDRATVERLLASGDNPNGSGDKDEPTPLCEAVRANNLAITNLLLAKGAVLTKAGCDPLELAVLGNDPQMLKLLLDRGADPAQDGLDLMLLLAHHPDGSRDNKGMVADIIGKIRATKGDTAAKVYLNARNKVGWTPVALAVWKNDMSLLSALLEIGADPNKLASAKAGDKTFEEGWPPLMFAWLADNDKAQELLLQHGAKRDARTQWGHSWSEVYERIEADREERRERAREEAREREEQRQANAAMFMQGLNAVAQGVNEGIQQANADRREAKSNYENLKRNYARPSPKSGSSGGSGGGSGRGATGGGAGGSAAGGAGRSVPPSPAEPAKTVAPTPAPAPAATKKECELERRPSAPVYAVGDSEAETRQKVERCSAARSPESLASEGPVTCTPPKNTKSLYSPDRQWLCERTCEYMRCAIGAVRQ